MFATLNALRNPERIFLQDLRRARKSGPFIEHLETDVETFTCLDTGAPATERRDHLRLTPKSEQMELAKTIMAKLAPDHSLNFDKLPPYETGEEFMPYEQFRQLTSWRDRLQPMEEIDRACSKLWMEFRRPWITGGPRIGFSLMRGFYRDYEISHPQPYDEKLYHEMAEQLKVVLCLKNPLPRSDYVRRSPETAVKAVGAGRLPQPVFV